MSPPPIVLGTVQLGAPYGVANTRGQPSRGEAFAILDAAAETGVKMLDTAHAYGTAEKVVGDWLRERKSCMGIVTKLPTCGAGGPAAAEQAFAESLHRLGVARVEGVLLHNARDWAVSGIADYLCRLKSQGRAAGIGVSVYSEDEIPNDDRLDMVQIPANLFVRSLARARTVEALTRRGSRIFVRSVFAQGVLLMSPVDIPARLAALRPHTLRLHALANEGGVSVSALSIACVRQLLPQADIVLGAETADQVVELGRAARSPIDPNLVEAALQLGTPDTEPLFDSRRWPRLTTPATGGIKA